MNNMEEKLKKLFEYQKFEQNKKLEEVINSTKVYVVDEVCDDALFAVTGGKNQDKPTEENK